MDISRRPNFICGCLSIKVTLQFYNHTRFVVKARNKAFLRSLQGQFREADFVNRTRQAKQKKAQLTTNSFWIWTAGISS